MFCWPFASCKNIHEERRNEGFNIEEIAAIQTTWQRAVKAGGNSLGKNIVVSLIAQKPKYGKYFKVPDNVAAEELENFEEVIAQGNRIQRFIDTLVKGLRPHSLETVLPLAKSIGVIHFHRGVNFEAETWILFKSAVISEVTKYNTEMCWLTTGMSGLRKVTNTRREQTAMSKAIGFNNPDLNAQMINEEVHRVWAKFLSIIVRVMKKGFLEETLRHCQHGDQPIRRSAATRMSEKSGHSDTSRQQITPAGSVKGKEGTLLKRFRSILDRPCRSEGEANSTSMCSPRNHLDNILIVVSQPTADSSDTAIIAKLPNLTIPCEFGKKESVRSISFDSTVQKLSSHGSTSGNEEQQPMLPLAHVISSRALDRMLRSPFDRRNTQIIDQLINSKEGLKKDLEEGYEPAAAASSDKRKHLRNAHTQTDWCIEMENTQLTD